MSAPLPPDPGPFGADTDDAVSALIDGELAGFAAERGLDVESVRASLNAWGGLEARRAYLERAVSALQEPAPLNPTDRATMVVAALAVTPDAAPVVPIAPRRRGPKVAAWLAAAAVLALVVAGGVVLFRPGSGGQSTATRRTEPAIEKVESSDPLGPGANTAITPDAAAPASSTPSQATKPAVTTNQATSSSPATSALGEISNPKTLINKVQPLVPSATLTNGGGTGSASGASVPTTGSCSAAGLFPTGSVIVLDTTATFNGQPAEVVAAQQNGRTFVYVLKPTGCSVLSAVSF